MTQRSPRWTPCHTVAPRYSVEAKDLLDYHDDISFIEANVGKRLFQLKPLALLYTDLEDVLLLDADNTPITDPTFLFDDPR